MNDNLFKMYCLAVLGAISESDQTQGCPGGSLYAAMMTVGIDINQCNKIMDFLLERKLIRREGHLYFKAGASA